MYGCNKLYCEQLGRYYARHYKQLVGRPAGRAGRLPLRAVPGPHLGDDRALGRHLRLRPGDDPRRRPGRAVRLLRPARHADPVHGDARRRRRRCWRWPRRRATALTRTAYNLGAFSPTAQQIHDRCAAAFPGAQLGWPIDIKRQGIVDSWPAEVDDSAARRDWGFAPGLRLRAGVRRVPDPDHPRPLRAGGALMRGSGSDRARRGSAAGLAGCRSSLHVLAGRLLARADSDRRHRRRRRRKLRPARPRPRPARRGVRRRLLRAGRVAQPRPSARSCRSSTSTSARRCWKSTCGGCRAVPPAARRCGARDAAPPVPGPAVERPADAHGDAAGPQAPLRRGVARALRRGGAAQRRGVVPGGDRRGRPRASAAAASWRRATPPSARRS